MFPFKAVIKRKKRVEKMLTGHQVKEKLTIPCQRCKKSRKTYTKTKKKQKLNTKQQSKIIV